MVLEDLGLLWRVCDVELILEFYNGVLMFWWDVYFGE